MPTHTPNIIFEDLLENNMIIEGGHYIVGDRIDATTLWTWKEAVGLYSLACQRQLRNIALCLLADDFSVDKNKRKKFRDHYRFPFSYQKILDMHEINGSEVHMFWTVRLRNQSRRDIKAKYKKWVKKESDCYFIDCVNGTRRMLTMKARALKSQLRAH